MRAVVCLTLLLLAGCASEREVEVLHPGRGRLVESFSEEARTRLSRTFPISMPAAGRIARISLEPGDRVTRGQELARFDREPAERDVQAASARVREVESRREAASDLRVEQSSLEQAQAQLEAVEKRLAVLEAERRELDARARQARTERDRARKLFDQGVISRQSLEQAVLAMETSREAVRQAEARIRAQQADREASRRQLAVLEAQRDRRRLDSLSLDAELAQAQARLDQARHESGQQSIVSPLDGVVLERYEQGPAELTGGTRLLLLGNLKDLEAVSEVLTEDALGLQPGTPVELESAPDQPTLAGSVWRIQPAGFTKLSSLGVEQQRVKVLIRFREVPRHLGSGYRLRARFVTGRREDALIIPRFSLLQRSDRSWYVLKVEGGRLKHHTVELGMQGEREVEVAGGLSPADVIVALPEATMEDGEKVRVRAGSNGPATPQERKP
ncbi:MAG: RND transporter [Candidatus Eremiobacterota bacterium]